MQPDRQFHETIPTQNHYAVLGGGLQQYNSTSIRRPFDCLSKVIKDKVT